MSKYQKDEHFLRQLLNLHHEVKIFHDEKKPGSRCHRPNKSFQEQKLWRCLYINRRRRHALFTSPTGVRFVSLDKPEWSTKGSTDVWTCTPWTNWWDDKSSKRGDTLPLDLPYAAVLKQRQAESGQKLWVCFGHFIKAEAVKRSGGEVEEQRDGSDRRLKDDPTVTLNEMRAPWSVLIAAPFCFN